VKEILPKLNRGQVNLALQKSLNEPNQRALTEYLERIDSLIQEINRIINDCVHLNSDRQIEEAKINEIRAQSKNIKESFDNSTKLIESLHQILANMHKLLDEIKSKPMAGPKLISSDNTYTWKLNYLPVINNGCAIQSEPVHTAQGGYKLALACEIHMDEKYQKRYVSVSFMILPGEFDAILSWPFQFPIALTLVDLTAVKKHIHHSIPLNFRTGAFDRPLSNAITPYKLSQFCPVDILENNNNYIQDGFMYIQMHINFAAPGVHPVSEKEQSKVIYDPIQTNIVSNIPTK
jgi:hypothetical protein